MNTSSSNLHTLLAALFGNVHIPAIKQSTLHSRYSSKQDNLDAITLAEAKRARKNAKRLLCLQKQSQ